MNRSSVLFCFCGPVASGKSTISTRLLKEVNNLQLSISSTTREPRPGEVEGIHYHFLTREEFQNRISQNGFIEYAEFNGNLYGTEKRAIDNALNLGQDLLLDIDVQGVRQLKELYPKNLVTIFVIPPSKDVLVSRLKARGSCESEAEILHRLSIASKEIKTLVSAGFSDYLLVNNDLDNAVSLAFSMVRAERNRFNRINPSFILDDFLK